MAHAIFLHFFLLILVLVYSKLCCFGAIKLLKNLHTSCCGWLTWFAFFFLHMLGLIYSEFIGSQDDGRIFLTCATKLRRAIHRSKE